MTFHGESPSCKMNENIALILIPKAQKIYQNWLIQYNAMKKKKLWQGVMANMVAEDSTLYLWGQ